MSVRTATGGKADWALGGGTNFVNIPEVRKWGISPVKPTKEYASSSTGGAKRRIGGIDDFTGTMDVYVDATGTNRIDGATLGIKAGATGTFRLYEDDDNSFDAPVYIDEVAYDVDIEEGNIIGCTVTFSGDGALVYPAP